MGKKWRFVLLITAGGVLLANSGEGVWQQLHPTVAPTPRTGHTLVSFNGDAYLFGGRANQQQASPASGAHRFNALWKYGSAKVTPGSYPDKRVDLFNDLWKYSSAENNWNMVNARNPPPSRFAHSAAVSGGKMFVFFGLDSNNVSSAQIFSYDFASNTWGEVNPSGPAPPARRLHSSVALPDGRILIFGGQLEQGTDASVWAFDPATNTFEKKAAHPQGGYSGHSAFRLADQLEMFTCFGHSEQTGEFTNEMWSYNPASNQWNPFRAPGTLPPARALHGSAQQEQKFWVFGGEGGGGKELNDAWELDFSNLSWNQKTDMLSPLAAAAAIALAIQ